MDTSKLRRKAENWLANEDLFIADAIENSKEVLIQLNKDQMLKSKNAKDATITPKYSSKYAAFKGFDNPNLKLSSDFQDEMDLIVDEREHFFTSFDFKTPFLTARYSDDIFGIAPSNENKQKKIVSANILKIYAKEVLS